MTKINKQRKNYIFNKLNLLLKPHWKKILLIFVFQLFSASLEILPNFLIGQTLKFLGSVEHFQNGIIQTLWYKITPPEINKIYIMMAIFCVVLSIVFIFTYKKNVLLEKIGEEIIYTLRSEFYSHIQSLDYEDLNKIPNGKLVTRTINDTDQLRMLFSYLLVDFFYNIAVWIMYLIAMFVISWYITLYMLIIVAVTIILTILFRVLARKAYLQLKDAQAEMNTFLSENLSGIKIVQIFNKADDKVKDFETKTKRVKKLQLRLRNFHMTFRPFLFFLNRLGQVLVFYLALKLIKNGEMSFENAFVFYSLVGNFFWPIEAVADQMDTLQNSLASADKIFDILDIKPRIVDAEDAITLSDFRGEIEFKNVWFSYLENEWILKDVSFKINPHENIAFVGATGSGKTTILSLLVKNYEPQKGEIFLDGINIKKIKKESLRKNIGQMMQDVFLFERSLRNNLTLFNTNISDNEIYEIAKYVGSYDIINKLPNKLDYKVEEKGNNFSQGERQLISFTRTLLYKPKVLVLDEATSNIDTESEILIQNSLKKIMEKNTMLVVAHRLSTIQHSDEIIVLSKGKVVEIGNHQELLKNKSYYYKLYKIQYEKSKEE